MVSATSFNDELKDEDEEENAEWSDDLKTEPLGVFFLVSTRFVSARNVGLLAFADFGL